MYNSPFLQVMSGSVLFGLMGLSSTQTDAVDWYVWVAEWRDTIGGEEQGAKCSRLGWLANRSSFTVTNLPVPLGQMKYC